MHDSWTLQIINRYNLAKRVPLQGTKTFAPRSGEAHLAPAALAGDLGEQG